MRHRLTTAAILLVGFAVMFFQTLNARQQAVAQAPVFRSRTDVVIFDVLVLDKHRQPVRGLTEKDFTIREDGRIQRIAGFSAFEVRADAGPLTGWMAEAPTDVSTNEGREGRLFVLVMDDALIPQEAWAISAAKHVAHTIIARLGPDDLAAIVFTGDNRKAQDFTRDKQKLLAALDGFNPGLVSYRFGLETGVDTDLTFYQSAIRTLSGVAEDLIAVPERRKAVFWISPGVPMDLCGIRPEEPGRPSLPQSPCRLPPPEMVDLARRADDLYWRAQKANVAFYPIDPVGLGGMREYLATRIGESPARVKSAAQQDFLAATAANTGGRTIMNINEFVQGLGAVLSENSAYYLIAFEPSNAKRDSELRRVQVRVNKPGVMVQTRTGYYGAQPAQAATVRTADVLDPNRAQLAQTIAGVLPSAGLPLRVSIAPFAAADRSNATVANVIGIRLSHPPLFSDGRPVTTVELLTAVFTAEGDQKAVLRERADIAWRPDRGDAGLYDVLSFVDLPAGRYQVRIAAQDLASGRRGSVFADVVVPDYRSPPLSLSPAVLSVTGSSVPHPSSSLASLLPAVPTTRREFFTNESVAACLRVYEVGPTPTRLRVSIELRGTEGRAPATELRTIDVEQFTAVDSRSGTSSTGSLFWAADVRYQIPLSMLSPGAHVLTVDATLGSTMQRRELGFIVR